MRNIPTLSKREITSYFLSPMAYIVLTLFLLAQGIIFWILITVLSDPRSLPTQAPMSLFFGGWLFFWFYLFLIAPAITMRLLAEERRSGTIEVLMTAPVTDWEVVLSKFFGALAFYGFLWLPTLVYVIILRHFARIDYGPIGSGYLGTLLLGAMFISVGLFTSSLTRSQILAYVLAFVMLILIFIMGLLGEAEFITNLHLATAFKYINLLDHFSDFGKGIVNTQPLIYYLSTTMLFLFLTVRVVESRKWR